MTLPSSGGATPDVRTTDIRDKWWTSSDQKFETTAATFSQKTTFADGTSSGTEWNKGSGYVYRTEGYSGRDAAATVTRPDYSKTTTIKHAPSQTTYDDYSFTADITGYSSVSNDVTGYRDTTTDSETLWTLTENGKTTTGGDASKGPTTVRSGEYNETITWPGFHSNANFYAPVIDTHTNGQLPQSANAKSAVPSGGITSGGDLLDQLASLTTNPVSRWLGDNVVRPALGDQFLLTTSGEKLVIYTAAASVVMVGAAYVAPVAGCSYAAAIVNGAAAAGVEYVGLKTVQYAINPEATSASVTELATTMATGGAFGALFRAAGKALGLGGCFVAGTEVTLSAVPDDTSSGRLEFAFDGEGPDRVTLSRRNAGTQTVERPATVTRQKRAIESVPLGARANTKNPRPWDYDDSLPEPNESTWLKVTFVVSKSDGSVVDIELLRPASWVDSLSLEPGSQLPFRLHELSLDGMATVIDIEPCPTLADGDGSVITGRFVTREVAATVRATLDGDSILEGTAIHPIWSLDRQDWVPLGELEEGEQLQGQDGPVIVTSIQTIHRATRVYNIEVHGEHVYQIGDLGILVHNAGGADCNLIGSIGEWMAKFSLQARGWKIVETLSHGRNGLDIIAQKEIRGVVRTIIVEAKANGARTSAYQRLGAEGYAKDVLIRLGGLENLSPGAQKAANLLQGMIDRKESIRGVIMRFDWRSGTLVETIKLWIKEVR